MRNLASAITKRRKSPQDLPRRGAWGLRLQEARRWFYRHFFRKFCQRRACKIGGGVVEFPRSLDYWKIESIHMALQVQRKTPLPFSENDLGVAPLRRGARAHYRNFLRSLSSHLLTRLEIKLEITPAPTICKKLKRISIMTLPSSPCQIGVLRQCLNFITMENFVNEGLAKSAALW